MRTTLRKLMRTKSKSHLFSLSITCVLLLGLGGAACALVADLGDRTLGDTSGDGGALKDSQGADGSKEDPPDGAPGPITGFGYHRTVTLTSDAPDTLKSYTVLVTIPNTFDYAHAKSVGEDVRFSTSATHTDDLPYYIEKWSPTSESLVWIRMPEVKPGKSTIHMFYGKADAKEVTDFAAAFPNVRRTAGGDAGSFVANGDIDVDWFELKAGDTLTLQGGIPIKITARRIIVSGTIDGVGAGEAGGQLENGRGSGPGGGSASPTELEGSGGGGYGGAGGRGGFDDAGIPGDGGAPYGSATDDTNAMGSGGGASRDRVGGAGGGAISLLGWKTTVSGAILMNGVDGAGLSGDAPASGHQGGGGSGGGILIGAAFLDLSGATLSANGGAGGPCPTTISDGGGGGGGGRIKLRRRANGSFFAPMTMTVAVGPGGGGNGTTSPGENGFLGTTNINDSSTLLQGPEAALGIEQGAP